MQTDTAPSPPSCDRCGRSDASSALTGVVVGGHDYGHLCLLCFDYVMRTIGREIRDELRRHRHQLRPSPRRIG